MPFRNGARSLAPWYRLGARWASSAEFFHQRVPPAVQQLLDYAKARRLIQVDYFIFHQANRMINETIRRKLELPVEKVPSTLRYFGNTSAGRCL